MVVENTGNKIVMPVTCCENRDEDWSLEYRHYAEAVLEAVLTCLSCDMEWNEVYSLVIEGMARVDCDCGEGEADIDYEMSERNYDNVVLEIECLTCGKQWEEVYSLDERSEVQSCTACQFYEKFEGWAASSFPPDPGEPTVEECGNLNHEEGNAMLDKEGVETGSKCGFFERKVVDDFQY